MKNHKNYFPRGSKPTSPFLSIVVPMMNEEMGLPAFFTRLVPALRACSLPHEIICVDDGSTDGTDKVLRALFKQYAESNIKIVRLSRNFGKDIALSAGLDYASGDVAIPIDADLQDPPELIPEMVRLWQQGYDIVYGVRTDRNSDSIIKRGVAGAFYGLFNILSSVKVPPHAGDFRLLDERVVNVLRCLPERNRFMKGLYSWVGFRQASVGFTRGRRGEGKTKWRSWRLWNYALDGIFGFSSAPLRIWSYVGFFIAAMAFLYGLYIITYTLRFGIAVPGYASLILSILFIGGVQIGILGILGEYVGRLFVEAKARPQYIVSALEGFVSTGDDGAISRN